MRQELLETSGESGKGEVRMHQPEQEERNCLLWAFTEFKQVLGRESGSIFCVLLGEKEVWEKLGFR